MTHVNSNQTENDSSKYINHERLKHSFFVLFCLNKRRDEAKMKRPLLLSSEREREKKNGKKFAVLKCTYLVLEVF